MGLKSFDPRVAYSDRLNPVLAKFPSGNFNEKENEYLRFHGSCKLLQSLEFTLSSTITEPKQMKSVL